MIKIAVCISGLLQCWDVTHQLFKYWNSMYDDVEFIFFISTWEVDSDFASTEKQYQKKGKLLTNTQYNSDTFDFIEDIEFISTDVIPKNILDENQSTAPFYSYQIYNVQKMRKNYEKQIGKKFDLVVQTREDMVIYKKTIDQFKHWYDLKQVVSGMYFTTSGTKVKDGAGKNGFRFLIPNDCFGFAHSDAMDEYAQMYNDTFIENTNHEKFGHFMNAQQLINKGIYNCKIGNTFRTFMLRKENELSDNGLSWHKKGRPTYETLKKVLDKNGVGWFYNKDENIQREVLRCFVC
jgi:hypothetical protein|tara:strand:+ start:630 stop:1505 length:876 start_codon:yes stop_codon:yes gene_type:complete